MLWGMMRSEIPAAGTVRPVWDESRKEGTIGRYIRNVCHEVRIPFYEATI